MTRVQVGQGDLAATAEFFRVPGDYPMVELEDGSLLPPGLYFWYVGEDGAPTSYACGPHDSLALALADAELGAARLAEDV